MTFLELCIPFFFGVIAGAMTTAVFARGMKKEL